MTDREYRAVVKSINRTIAYWKEVMGLRDWCIEVEVLRDASLMVSAEQISNNVYTSTALMDCQVDWSYMHGYIRINGPIVLTLPDDIIEHAVVHELAHHLVNELSTNGPSPHEERVVTMITNSILNAYDEGYRAGKKAA